MKKLLSIVLVLCLLLTGCLAFSSCAKVKPKDVEKDAQAVLSEAMKNTTSEFFSDDAGLEKVINSAFKGGSVTVSFEGDKDLLGEDIKINETLYFNRKDQKYVSDTSVTLGEDTLSARVFLDKNGLAVNSASVLGSNKTLAINFATLASGFETSALKDMVAAEGAEDEDIAQIVQLLGVLKAEYEALFAEDAEEKFKADINAYYALMNQTVSSETITGANGKDVTCVVVSYTLTNNAMKAIFDKMLADMDLTGDLKTETKAAVDEMMEELNSSVSFNLVAKTYINGKTNKVEKETVNGTVAVLEENTTGTIALEVVYGATEIKATLKLDAAEEKLEADATLTKEEKNGEVIYKLVVNGGDGKGATVNALNATYTYTKKTGAFVLAADVYSEGDERETFTVNGSIVANKNDAKIEITSVKTNDDTFDFKFSITFNKSADIPQLPADAKDIVTLTESEWEDIVKDIMENSKLAEIMGDEDGLLPEII